MPSLPPQALISVAYSAGCGQSVWQLGELSVFSNGRVEEEEVGWLGGLADTHTVVYDGWVEDKSRLTDT